VGFNGPYRPGRIGTLPPVGAADRLRSWGRRVWANPWLLVGIVGAFLLICAWIGWAIYVTDEHGARQGLGVLIVWPAIVGVLALVSIPFVWAARVIRASARSPESGSDVEPDARDAETS
jgi:type VI protein secretion system component VasK